MQCNEVEKWIGPLVDDEVGSLLKKEVETHVGHCRSCGRLLENARALKSVLRNSLPPLSPPSRLDAKVMGAFHSAREKREAGKTGAWRGAIFQRAGIPKPVFAILAVTIAASLGSAFLLGRASISLAQSPASTEVLSEHEKVSVGADPPAKIIEIPVTKVVEIPIIKEKIITRYIYVNKQNKENDQIKSVRDNPQTDTLELNVSIAENGYITQTSLKGFQPTAGIKIGVQKGGKDNEK